MLVYIAGPYGQSKGADTETIQWNIERAAEVAIALWEKGHAVICPHMNTAHFETKCSITWDDYIAGDLNMIARCDAIVMLPNWRESRGAEIEHTYAESLGMPIYIWPDAPELHPTEVRCPQQVKAFREVLGRLYRTHLDKNADYSPANILATGEIGLVTRLWDKIARLLNLHGFRFEIKEAGTYEAPRKPKNESIEDTYGDAAVYSVIGLLLRENKWGK